jgi:hypothetical protein
MHQTQAWHCASRLRTESHPLRIFRLTQPSQSEKTLLLMLEHCTFVQRRKGVGSYSHDSLSLAITQSSRAVALIQSQYSGLFDHNLMWTQRANHIHALPL